MGAQLTAWRDNDSFVAQMVAGSYLLQEIVPLSRDVRRSLKQASRHSTRSSRARCCPPTGRPLFATALRHRQKATTSTTVVGALTSPQPAHGLRIAIVDGITDLGEAAAAAVNR